MKRIHLFEFEDFTWFPDWIRNSMTGLINVMHKLLKTKEDIKPLLEKLLIESNENTVLDLCSGSGGPMPHVFEDLVQKKEWNDLKMNLSDLYPPRSYVQKINEKNTGLHYIENAVNVITDQEHEGIRTLICSFHHMKPNVARQILESAKKNKKNILIYEMSDNSFPKLLWWIAFPINIISCLFITPLVRPLTPIQLFFTYILPIIPICYAWDGAVSNARTYTLDDLDILLEGLSDDTYSWEKGIIKGKANKLYLIGKNND